MSTRRKGQESGFALLFVMVAAAMIAIMLYAELPRVAFEGQRTKEGDLIAHGEQYQRAIKLFYRSFGRYPPSIEALENTNNRRFLRHRFKDPMTGKDEWRFIHSAGGGFPDSLTMKGQGPKVAGMTSASDMADASSGSASTSSSTDQPQQTQRWQMQRPGPTGAPDMSGNPDAPPPDYSQQQGVGGGPVAVPGQQGYYVPGQPGDPNQTLQPGQPGYQQMQGNPNQPGLPGRRQYPGGGPNQPLYPPVALPGMPSGDMNSQFGSQQGNGASQGIGSGSSTLGSNSGSGGFGAIAAGGAGIAGVASKSEDSGIKLYNTRAKYKEWEFVYDPRKDLLGIPTNQTPTDTTGMQGAPGFGPGSQPVNQPGFGTTQSPTQQQSAPQGTNGP